MTAGYRPVAQPSCSTIPDAHIAGWQPFLSDPVTRSRSREPWTSKASRARPVTGTLELFLDAGDVAMRYRSSPPARTELLLILSGAQKASATASNPLALA